MTNLIIRANKIVIGSCLILATMLWNTSAEGIVVLPLIAIPIIVAGMFDWRPLEYVLGKLLEISKSKAPLLKTGLGPV